LAAISVNNVDLVTLLVINIQDDVHELEWENDFSKVYIVTVLNEIDFKFWSAEAQEGALAWF